MIQVSEDSIDNPFGTSRVGEAGEDIGTPSDFSERSLDSVSGTDFDAVLFRTVEEVE